MAKNEFEAILELTEKAELRTKEFNKLRASMKDYGSQEYKRVKGYAALQEKINTNLEKALKTRATFEAKNLKEVSERMHNNHLNMIKNIKERQKAEESGDKKKIEKINKQFQRQLKFYENEKKNAQQTIDGLSKYGKAVDDLNYRAKGGIFDPQVGFFGSGAKLKDFDKNVEFMETRLVGAAEAVGDAFSGNLDTVMGRIDKIGKGTGNFLKDMNTAAKMKYGDKAEGGSKSAKGILNVTKGLGKFGAALGGITVAMGALFAIFKIAQQVEEAIKGINKELVETYGASDLVGAGMDNVYENVNKIRKGLSDAAFANQLGVTLEQARGLAMEFQNIGINFMSLSEDGKDIYHGIEQMKTATLEFQAAAKTLGVGFSDLVDFGKDLTQEMGISVAHGAGLERMSREFGRIRDLAKQSALSTKDFFSTIKDLSQGMGTMNVRIGEAANLFTRLGKVMGPEAAQAFVKNLAGAFKGEGIQDRFKRIILTGNMKGVFKRSAEQTKKDFFSIYKSDKIKGIFNSLKIDKSTDFSKMSDADLEKAMGVLRRKGGTEGEGAARQLMQSVRLARGGKGGLSNQALALGDLDMTGAFSAQMKQLYNVTGGKGFRDVTAIEMEKISQMTGKSLQELEGMRQIDMAMRDDFRVLQEIKKTNTDSLGRKDPLKIQEALRKAGLKDLKVDKKGNVIDKEGRRIDNIQDYISSQGSALDEVKTGTYDQLTLLQEVADSTLTSADMINNHLGGLLQQLNNPLQFMADVMGSKDKSRGKRKQVAERLQGGIDDSTKKLEAEKQKRRDEFGKERRRVAGIKDHKKRQVAEAALEERRTKDREHIAKEQAKIDDEKAKVRILLGGEGRKIQGDNLKDLESQAVGRLQRKKARSESGRGQLTNEQAIVAQIFNAFEAGGVDTKNMQATKGNLLSLLTTNQSEISEEGDVKSTEDLEKMFQIIQQSGLSTGFMVGGAGHEIKNNIGALATHGIVELFGNLTGISSGKEDSRSTSSTFIITDKEGRTLSGSTEEGHKEGSSIFGLKATDDKNYSGGGAKATIQEGSKLAKKRDEELIKQGVSAEKQLEALNKLDKPSAAQIKKKEELKGKVEAKNKVLQDARKKTMVEALLESDRQKLRNQVMADFGGSAENFDSKQGRRSYISKIESQLKKTSKDDNPERYAELLQLRRNFKTYYAQDAKISPGGGPPFIGNAGSLVRGTDTDTAMLVDLTKAGGGGGARGNVVFNVNGNNESAMIASIESYMRSIGFIS